MKEPNNPYWIVDDAIIFKPSFNECLDDYTQIISNYKVLYFSNHTDPLIALKNKNNPCLTNNESNIWSLFDQPLGNSLSNLVYLRELTFGDHFNHPLNNSLSNLVNLRELTFGNHFNHPPK